MNTEIIATSQQEMFLPIMNVELAIQRRDYLVKFVQGIMKDGHDFGKIPGAGDKPTLLKPGAEKLATFFGLTPVFIPVSVTEDWMGIGYNGEPFFYYRYKCELWRVGNLIATAEASCNSHESKYRYRKGERICPQCGAAAIIKGKAEYGGGWVCFKKKGGCDAKFKDNDTAITDQSVGRIANPDVADQVNTMQKMAQKRAMIAAILLAVNASEFFTQDIEDLVTDAEFVVVESPKQQPAANKPQRNQQPPQEPPPVDLDFYPPPAEQPELKDQTNGHQPKAGIITESQRNTLHALGTVLYNGGWDAKRHVLVKVATNGRVTSSNDLWQAEAKQLISGKDGRGGLEGKVREAYTALAEQLTAGVAAMDPGVFAEVDGLNGVELANSYKALRELAEKSEPVPA